MRFESNVALLCVGGLALGLAACAPAASNQAPATASSSPLAPSAVPSGAPSTAGASAAPGAKAVVVRRMALKVAGVDYPLDLTQAVFSPTDLLGKRLRFGLTVGKTDLAEGQGLVSFLVGQSKGLYPAFTIEEGSQSTFSVQVQVWPAKSFAVSRYQLTTNTSKVTTKTLTAADGQVSGRLEVAAVREGGGLAGEIVRDPVELDFDFTQPAL